MRKPAMEALFGPQSERLSFNNARQMSVLAQNIGTSSANVEVGLGASAQAE
jgi:hypothetical protein